MLSHALLIILFRWIHLAAAAIAVGGVFFIRFIFPVGQKTLEPAPARTAFLRTRRAFKMVIHSCILLLLISGAYNAIHNWPGYTAAGPAIGHGLFSLHLLLALIVFGVALWLLAGAEPPATHQKWAAINFVLLLLTIAAASTVKYARENATAAPSHPAAVNTP